jgi:TonB-linked SusC/RagA family outer membrane protein
MKNKIPKAVGLNRLLLYGMAAQFLLLSFQPSAIASELRNIPETHKASSHHLFLSHHNRLAVHQPIPLPSVIDVTVTGKVTDEKGDPLPGVTVSVPGTTIGTATDLDGEYSLTVAEGSTLVFSFIGFESQTIALGGRSTIDIVLKEDMASLEEVVVVGYGEQKRATITGSIATVGGDKLAAVPAINYSNTLAGRIPGLTAVTRTGEPGGDAATLRIRGANTLGNNSPLIVVDGIANRGLDRLNPTDIESITVLKDASAAIYGAQAANGVILITTKRGNIGAPEVTAEFNQGWAMPTMLPKMADAQTYATMLNEVSQYNGQAPVYTAEEVQKFGDGSDIWRYPNTNWFEETLKPSTQQRTGNLSVRGGSENMNYFVSVGGNFQDGIYINSATKYSQVNFRANLDGKISENIKMSFDVAGRQENRNYPTRSASSIFSFLMRGKPTLHAYWPNGLNGPDIEYGDNPVVITTDQTGYDKDKIFDLNSRMNLDITLPWIKGLSITGNIAVDKTFQNNKLWQTPWYLYTWDGVTYNENNEPHLVRGQRGYSDPRLRQTGTETQRVTINGLINYNRSFNDTHHLSLLVGSERISGESMNFGGFRRYFISTAVDQLFAGGELEQAAFGSATKNARLNYFGRANYDFLGKYLFEFVFRYDGSYIFPAEGRYGFFPGVSAGWVMTEENFLKNKVSWINFLKIRGSWGQTGNDRIEPFQFLTSYGFGSTNYVFNESWEDKTLSELRIANPNITWEVANQSNIGIDGQFFNGRFTVAADYFYNLRTNILWQRSASVPYTSGLTLPRENIGEVVNQGVELALGYSNTAGQLSYTVSVNGGYQQNEIKFWDETPGAPEWQRSTGSPMNTTLVYKAIGVFKDQAAVDAYPSWVGARPGDIIFEDVNQDGVIDGLDRVRIQKTDLPTFQGGLNIDLRYKNFYSNIFFQGATGAQRNMYYEFQGEGGNYRMADAEGRWTEENPTATKPRAWNRYAEYWRNYSNTYWLVDSDYLRLKNLVVGYNFSNPFFGNARLNVYVSGMNLFTWTTIEDHDPESTSNTAYPLNKVYNVGAVLSF